MKRSKKTTVASILLFLLTASVFSCGDNGNAGTDTQVPTSSNASETAEVTTEPIPTPDLPEKDYEGYHFKFLHWEDNVEASKAVSYLTAEEETGEALNDAVFARNMKIGEQYNVTFSAVYEDLNKLPTTYQKFVRAGDAEYDVVCPLGYNIVKIVSEGLALDLFTLPHIDWTDPWWDQNAVKELQIHGTLPMVNSDFTITDKCGAACMVFNKKLQGENDIEDIYALVRDGKWTIDKMMELSANISKDLNGDGKYDENDLYGISGSTGFSYQLMHGADCWYIRKNANGTPELTFWNDRSASVFEKIKSIGEDKQGFFNAHNFSSEPDAVRINMFLNNKGLFSNTNIGAVCALRNMETDFGVVPIPKYDESQESYYCIASNYSAVVTTVPVTTQDPERTAILLTALAAESNQTTIREFIEVILKGKGARDTDSEEMISIIINNRAYDWGEYFQIGGFPTKINDWFKNPTQDMASLYEKNRSKMEADVEKLLEIGLS